MTTLLGALTSKNPGLDTSRLPWGPNTDSEPDFQPVGWVPWVDFTYDNLTTIFSEQLKTRYDGPSTRNSSALPLDLEICNEHTFELSLHRFIMPTVNHCLNSSSKGTHYGSGSRCTHPLAIPDWSCIGRGVYHNYVPGDTKPSTKFQPEMLSTNFKEWKKVVGQVVFYQSLFASRYGFIITDDVLVVMRISCERTGPGIATSRTKRHGKTVVQHDDDGDDSIFANTSTSFHDDGSSFANTTASFIDDQPTGWEMNLPEYAIVRWDAHGPKRLTVRLALWCLAMMAVEGGNHIDYSYPALNSWRVERGRYVHNVSGALKTRLRHRDIVQGPDPAASIESSYTEDAAPGSAYGGSGQGEDEAEEEEGEEEGQEEVEEEVEEEEGEQEEGEQQYGEQQYGEQQYGEQQYGEQQYGAYDLAGNDGEDAEAADEATGHPEPEAQTYGGDEDADADDAVAGVAGGHDSDTDTIVSGLRRMRVTIKKRRLTRQPYFIDARRREVNTDISEWTRVGGHYELSGRRHVYVADTFPK